MVEDWKQKFCDIQLSKRLLLPSPHWSTGICRCCQLCYYCTLLGNQETLHQFHILNMTLNQGWTCDLCLQTVLEAQTPQLLLKGVIQLSESEVESESEGPHLEEGHQVGLRRRLEFRLQAAGELLRLDLGVLSG